MAFTEASLRTLRFHGPLIAEFGRDFKYRAHSATKMISAAKICYLTLSIICWQRISVD